VSEQTMQARLRLLSSIWDGVDSTTAWTVEETTSREASRVAARFYAVLLEDEQGRKILDHQIVRDRLTGSLTDWLRTVFVRPRATESERWIERHAQIGNVHARVGVPPMLVSRGMRLIKHELCDALPRSEDQRGAYEKAVPFIHDVLDFALDCMNDAYFVGVTRQVRQTHSLRLFMAGPRLALECERQKAHLYNWHRKVVSRALSRSRDTDALPLLADSELMLWIKHKAEFTLGESLEAAALVDGLATLERAFDAVRADLAAEQEVGRSRLQALDLAVTDLGFKLESVADRVIGTEAGLDALTQVLNRRYLPTILQQEVALSREHDNPFALLLIDIDYFKQINDSYGHDSGDLVLAQLAQVLAASVRGGDFVFRYGGEEFLVLLAEVDAPIARRKAEQIRAEVAALRFENSALQSYRLTVSIGVAVHDGHPDFERVLQEADRALYRAKREGRNRVCLAESEGVDERVRSRQAALEIFDRTE
jgi:diguanylate cyclase